MCVRVNRSHPNKEKKAQKQEREKCMTDASPDFTKARQEIYGKKINAKSGSATILKISKINARKQEKRFNDKCAKIKKYTTQNKNSISAQKI